MLALVGCAPQGQMSTKDGDAMEEKTPGETTSAGEGRAVFTITDAAADMGAVTSVKVTVDSVSVHSAEKGWVKVASPAKTYDLLKLKAEGSQELLADVKLDADTYQQVRLDISKVVVTDAEGDHEAKLPSGELKIVGDLTVKEESTSTATFDFIADRSLHVTGNGEYILAPVVRFETKEDADVAVEATGKVKVSGGRVKANVEVGMDETGNVGVGLRLGQDAVLSIESGKIKIGALVSSGAKTNASSEAKEKSGSSASIDVDVGANVSAS